MNLSQLKWTSDFIWNIEDDYPRDVCGRGQYRAVILPFTVLRQLDAVLESTKHAVLEHKKFLYTQKVAEQNTVYALISKKGIPAHRVGRFWKFQRVEADAWVREGGADESVIPANDASPSQDQQEPKAKGSKA